MANFSDHLFSESIYLRPQLGLAMVSLATHWNCNYKTSRSNRSIDD